VAFSCGLISVQRLHKGPPRLSHGLALRGFQDAPAKLAEPELRLDRRVEILVKVCDHVPRVPNNSVFSIKHRLIPSAAVRR
jgi:hypothetical protein